MSLEVTGKLHHVYETQQIKETFSKREFVLEINEESPSGMVYTNYAAFQLVNMATGLVDQFHLGDTIKVSFNIRGNRWERDGNVKYITNLNAWRIERAGGAEQSTPAPNATYTQQHNQAASAANQASNQQAQNGSVENDDLPF